MARLTDDEVFDMMVNRAQGELESPDRLVEDCAGRITAYLAHYEAGGDAVIYDLHERGTAGPIARVRVTIEVLP